MRRRRRFRPGQPSRDPIAGNSRTGGPSKTGPLVRRRGSELRRLAQSSDPRAAGDVEEVSVSHHETKPAMKDKAGMKDMKATTKKAASTKKK